MEVTAKIKFKTMYCTIGLGNSLPQFIIEQYTAQLHLESSC